MVIEGNIEIIGHKVARERISDLLCCAFEGGSNYWYQIAGYSYPSGKSREDFEFPHIEVPLVENGSMTIDALDAPEYSGKILDLESIRKGLQLLHDLYSTHFNDLLIGNEDAETGDVFLQLCLFGEVIFG